MTDREPAAGGISVANFVEALDALWPREVAEEWDAVGLVLGSPSAPVRRVSLVVDVTEETVQEAIDQDVDLIVAHHPLLLRPVNSLAEDQPKGHLVATLVRAGIALFSAHTNADSVDGGTSETLGRALGLLAMAPIVESRAPGVGIGRVGDLPQPVLLYDLTTQLGRLVPQTPGGLKVSGDPNQLVSRVALCSGAGDSLLNHPEVLASDAYITGDLRHHPASDLKQARALGKAPSLIDVSHFASEWFFLDAVSRQLQQQLPTVDIRVSEVVTDPWDFVVHPG
ncbi:MAG: Nif3-like dinuclear metal center hexameric protein [Pontimonas sp.]